MQEAWPSLMNCQMRNQKPGFLQSLEVDSSLDNPEDAVAVLTMPPSTARTAMKKDIQLQTLTWQINDQPSPLHAPSIHDGPSAPSIHAAASYWCFEDHLKILIAKSRHIAAYWQLILFTYKIKLLHLTVVRNQLFTQNGQLYNKINGTVIEELWPE